MVEQVTSSWSVFIQQLMVILLVYFIFGLLIIRVYISVITRPVHICGWNSFGVMLKLFKYNTVVSRRETSALFYSFHFIHFINAAIIVSIGWVHLPVEQTGRPDRQSLT